MTWTCEIGGQGTSLDAYPVVDFEFVKRLNAVGFGYAILPGLDGNSEPVEDDVIRFIFTTGGTDYVHFEGIIMHSERLGDEPTRKVTFMDVASALLWKSRTGDVRHFEDKTPHDIIQGSGSPDNLLKNAQGTQVLTYGSSASVPDKVNGSNTGTALDDFLADSTRLIINVQRLCLQARYDGSSYGLEFFGQLEGANNSNPRFYLVKRKAQSPAPGETFTVGTDIVKARRGEKGLTAAEALRVVGGGHGQSRIQSSLIGSGGIEGVVQDKSIINSTNATNMANRLQGILDPTTLAVTAWGYKHDFTSDTGDTVTFAQSGFSNESLRIYEIGYSLRRKQFIFQLGRPRPLDKDPFYSLEGIAGAHGTAPQKRGNADAGINITSNGALADTDTIELGIPFQNGVEYNELVHDGISVWVQFATDIDGDYDLRVTLAEDVSTEVDFILERFQVQSTDTDGSGRSMYQKTFWIDSSLLSAVGVGLEKVVGGTVAVTNRTGSVTDADVVLGARPTVSGG